MFGGHGKSVVVVAILLASAYSVSDEWHQSMVPQRTPELNDLLLDFFGAALAALLASRLLSGMVDRRKVPEKTSARAGRKDSRI